MGTVVSNGATPLAAAPLGAIAYGERHSAVWTPASALAVAGSARMAWRGRRQRLETIQWPLASDLFYGLQETEYEKCNCYHLKTAEMR